MTMGAEGTILCPLEAKNCVKEALISVEVMPLVLTYLQCILQNGVQKYGFIITFAGIRLKKVDTTGGQET
jgi:hypothetical protein